MVLQLGWEMLIFLEMNVVFLMMVVLFFYLGLMDEKIKYYDYLYPDGSIKMTNENSEGLSEFTFRSGDVI